MGNSGIEVPITKKLYQILCRIGHRRILLRLASHDLHVHWPFNSDTSGKVSNLELLFSSQKVRSDQRILVLVSEPENEDNKSRSRLHARDYRRFFLDLVSKPEI